MVKLHALPALSIIKGFKGVIDFYVNYQSCDRSIAGPGIPCARSWPSSPGHDRAPDVEAQWAAFAWAAKNWQSLDPYVQKAYKSTTQETNLTSRDLFTKAFIRDYFRDGQWYKPVSNPLPIPEEELVKPKCYVYLSADFLNIPSGVWNVVPFNLNRYDYGGNFDLINNRFVCPIDGQYLAICALRWAQAVVNQWYISGVYLNGAPYSFSVINKANDTTPHTICTTIVSAAAGDLIQGVCLHTNPAPTPDISAASVAAETYLLVCLLE